MKKGLPVIFLLFSCAWAFGQVYRSNASGMELNAINPQQRGEYRWVLEVSRDAGEVRQILYHDGQEYQQRILTYDRDVLVSERIVKNGRDSEWTTYRPDGRILTVVQFDDQGKISEDRRYIYSNNTLSYIEVLDSEGQPLYRDVYSLREDGSLRRILHLSSEEQFILGWRSQASFTKKGDKLEISFYGTDGLTERVELWSGSFLQESTEITRFREGGYQKRWTSYLSNEHSISRYNSQGLLVSEESFIDDILASTTVYFYDDRQRLTRRNFTGFGKKEHSEFFYDENTPEGEDPRLVREDYYINGVLHSRIHSTGSGSERRDYYRKGQLFLQVFYEDQQIIKEVLIKDGELLRERNKE